MVEIKYPLRQKNIDAYAGMLEYSRRILSDSPSRID